MTAKVLDLPVCAPFKFAESLSFLRGFPATRDEQLVTPDSFTKAWHIAGQVVVARISTADPDQSTDRLRCELVTSKPLDDAARSQVLDRIGFFLGADDDLDAFRATAADDPGFAPVAQRFEGYHQVKFPTPLENICWAILSQRQPMATAKEAKRTLTALFGNHLDAWGETYSAFPSLEQLSTLTVPEFQEAVGNTRKGSYLHGSVAGLQSVDEEFLRTGATEDVREFLLSLPGIGPWSAGFVLIRGLGHMNVLPEDKEIFAAASKAYGCPVGAAELPGLAERYAPLQGYWAHYLRRAG